LSRSNTAPEGKGAVLRFRHFAIFPGARLLLADDSPVPIGSRAFDLLVVLVKARGTVVSKETIFRRVWPSTIVEESNLRFQMACVRKALGRDRDLIKTIPGRGYLLAADADDQLMAEPAEQRPARVSMAGQLVWADVVAAHSSGVSRPTVVLFGGDGLMRERVEALLGLAGVPVQLFGSVNAFLSEARASA
jgi:DNA-binding winged helix-turn-helix (wHTH) protein